jgi:hypothetical protein
VRNQTNGTRRRVILAGGAALLLAACDVALGLSDLHPAPDAGAGPGIDSGADSAGGPDSAGGADSAGGSDAIADGTVATDGSSGGPGDAGGDGSPPILSTLYANTDLSLYSIDPSTNAVLTLGSFVGLPDGGAGTGITDVAVNGAGEIFACSEIAIYSVTLPASPPAPIQLTSVVAIAGTGKFYALAFAPVGALDGAAETLVGGDSNGTLWAIDTKNGATTNLGSFGFDPTVGDGGTNVFGLSGDMVFYLDDQSRPTGIATIRSCTPGPGAVVCGNDYLAGVNMSALKTAYAQKVPAGSLMGGIYGATSKSLGSGTTFREVYGLAAWNQKVFGFSRWTAAQPPTMLTIDPVTGAGKTVQNGWNFMNGWSGAAVTTKVSITIAAPPAPYW